MNDHVVKLNRQYILRPIANGWWHGLLCSLFRQPLPVQLTIRITKAE